MSFFFLPVISLLLLLLTATPACTAPLVSPTERYQTEMLRLVIAEANRVARQLNLDEQLPIAQSNLTVVSLIPAGKTYGPLGVIETLNYAYSMDVKDFGVVVSGIFRKGYQDFHEAKANYDWPITRYDTNRAFQVAAELMTRAEIDIDGLNRDCVVRIDAPEERGLMGHHFYPIYTVSWFQKTNTFRIRTGEHVALIEFIEPLKRIRQLQLSPLLRDSKYNLRKPIQAANFIKLLTPENPRETVAFAIEMATNHVKRLEFLSRGNPSESFLREVWSDYTNAPFPTSILNRTNDSVAPLKPSKP